MSLEEFAWGTAVLAAVNGVGMWLAIKLFDFGNERDKLPAAIVWSIPFSLLVHLHAQFGGAYGVPPFLIMALMIFYAVLLKWYDLEVWRTLKVAVVTLGLDVATYIALTKVGILPALVPGPAAGSHLSRTRLGEAVQVLIMRFLAQR